MLDIVIVILVCLWLLGYFSAYTAGGLLHLLLIVAVIVLIVRMMQGRRL